MIVSPINKGWEIIFHKAHALLAMDIGLKLDTSLWPIPKYWAAGMESIGEHDNNQPLWHKRNNLTESGAPLDYRQREAVNLEQSKVCLRQLTKGEFLIDPWPFSIDEVVFSTEYFTTSFNFYKEDQDLKNDLDLLHPSLKSFRFHKKLIQK